MFTFHRTTTDRNITFSTKERPNNIQSVDSAEARTCYIFKITNVSDSLLQYTVLCFGDYLYSKRHIDILTQTDRPAGGQRYKRAKKQTGRQAGRQAGRQICRRLERQTSRGTDRRTGEQIGSSETNRQSQTDKLRDRPEQPGRQTERHRQTERQI